MSNPKKNKIAVICPYPFGVAAGQRLKYEQYFDHWRDNHFDITIFPFMSDKLWNIAYEKGYLLTKSIETIKGYFKRFSILFVLKQYDLVYVHQWTTPYGTSLYDILLRAFSKKLIFDLEDFVVVKDNGVRSTSKFISFFRFSKRTKFLIKNADHVISSSPTLNDYCIKLNKNSLSTYVSSSINTDLFVPKNNYKNDHKIVLGWTGTFSSIPFLESIKNVLIELNKVCDFKLRVISNCDFKADELDVELISWTKEKEVEDLQGIDIGLYPLEDSEWVLGKSGLKALQYMSFGIPTVATSVGTSKIIIQDNFNGFLVKNEEEWIKILKKLIEDASLRRRIGNEARKTIIDKYSKKVIKKIYLQILKNQTKL